jgi:hypothetical protein
MKKKCSPHPINPKLKRKKIKAHLECMLQPTHWMHVSFISKTVDRHFWPRLMQGEEIEEGRKTKTNFPQKEKTRARHECLLSLPIGCMKFLFPKLFVTIFALS